MRILKKIIFVFLVASIAFFSGPAASAADEISQFRIGLIGADPGKLLHDFDPFVEYLQNHLRHSGIKHVSLFVAKDLDQMHARLKKGKLDFLITSVFPIIKMEPFKLVPALVGYQGTSHEYLTVFFVRKESSFQTLSDLRGKSIIFKTPSSTTGYAAPKAELERNNLSSRKWSDKDAPEDAVRYAFAGEALNQAFRVIRNRADAGAFSSSDWDGLPSKEQSRLRIFHRTAPIIGLIGSFHPSFSPTLRESVQKTLLDMSGNRKGRTALTRALNITKLEPVTEEDRSSLHSLKLQFSGLD